MARIRTIKPDFFTNEQVASLPFHWRLLFVGLWTQADREGRLEDRPLRLKAELFAYDDLDVKDGLESLHRVGLISRYEANGIKVIMITNFVKHQRPHPREEASALPAPVDHEAVKRCAGREGDLRKEISGREGKEISDHAALIARFSRFWASYPRKTAKDPALKEWLKLQPDDTLTERMIAKVDAYKASPQWRTDDGKYIPHARTFLHQRRFDDEVQGIQQASPRWVCPHVQRCSNQAQCQQSSILGRPTKVAS